MPLEIHVSALAAGRILDDCARVLPTHVLSLVDPGTPRLLLQPAPGRHLVLQFADSQDPKAGRGPTAALVAGLVAFLREATGAEAARLIVHCAQGQSRSPAAAYVAWALHFGPGREAEAFAAMRRAAPRCWPNRLLVALADAHLERDGALTAELDAFRARFRPPGGARLLDPS